MIKKPFILVGAGGHATVLLDTALLLNFEILGMTDADPHKRGSELLGLPIRGDDDWIFKNYAPEKVLLINGMGSLGDTSLREKIHNKFISRGFQFAKIIHPTAIVSSFVKMGTGVQIMAGAVVQANTFLGDSVVVDTRASIDHDCHISEHSFICPGVVMCGGIVLGTGCHVGQGSVISDGVKVPDRSVILAASLVQAPSEIIPRSHPTLNS